MKKCEVREYNMRKILIDVLKDVANGCIIIDNDEFNIGFNTVIYDNNKVVLNTTINEQLPTLIIKDFDLFVKKMNDYVLTFQNKRTKLPTIVQDKDNGLLKFIIAYLFANASTLDFTNPIPFIDRNINFLLDDNLDALKDGISIGPLSNFQNSYLYIKLDEQSPFMETPYKIDISLIKKENNQLLKYHLPSVGYGISSNTAYIFFLENPKYKNIVQSEEQIKYEKKIKRELYKINALVNEQETMEYHSYYNNESDYYPENISDVSPSAVLSATVFINLLLQNGISNIKIIDYLPVRWYAKDMAVTKLIETKTNLTEEEKLEIRNKQILIQQNITNKFLRTFRRLQFHFPDINITSLPKELDDYMHIKLDGNLDLCNNDILQEVSNLIKENDYIKTNLKR